MYRKISSAEKSAENASDDGAGKLLDDTEKTKDGDVRSKRQVTSAGGRWRKRLMAWSRHSDASPWECDELGELKEEVDDERNRFYYVMF